MLCETAISVLQVILQAWLPPPVAPVVMPLITLISCNDHFLRVTTDWRTSTRPEDELLTTRWIITCCHAVVFNS